MTGSYPTEEYTVARRGSQPGLRDSEGTEWRVEVRLPGASNAMVVFHHPRSSQLNRYAWQIWRGPEARSVTARVPADRVAAALTDGELATLFRRSMPISRLANLRTSEPVNQRVANQ